MTDENQVPNGAMHSENNTKKSVRILESDYAKLMCSVAGMVLGGFLPAVWGTVVPLGCLFSSIYYGCKTFVRAGRISCEDKAMEKLEKRSDPVAKYEIERQNQELNDMKRSSKMTNREPAPKNEGLLKRLKRAMNQGKMSIISTKKERN